MGGSLTRRKIRANATYNSPHRLFMGGVLQGGKFEQMQLITLPHRLFLWGEVLQGEKFEQMQLITLPIDFFMGGSLTRQIIRANATYNSPHRLFYGEKSYKAENSSKCNL